MQEETFASALLVQRAHDAAEAIRFLNGVRQGLAAGIFTNDAAPRERFLRDAKAGILKINAATVEAGVDVLFGGWKTSGSSCALWRKGITFPKCACCASDRSQFSLGASRNSDGNFPRRAAL